MDKIFLDMEFTGLNQFTTPISIGMVDEYNRSFYAEFGDYDHLQVDAWIKNNVISKLKYHGDIEGKKGWCNTSTIGNSTESYGNKEHIAKSIEDWLFDYRKIEIWSDCLSYDWVLFNDLWGYAFDIPKNIYYIPFDICTVFKMKGIDPDVNREEFSGMDINLQVEKHNALWDAKVIKACYEKLIKM